MDDLDMSGVTRESVDTLTIAWSDIRILDKCNNILFLLYIFS